MLDANPTYRPMMVIDAERSAGRGDVALTENRAVLAAAVRAAFDESQLDWNSCHRDDTGDGLRIVAGPDITKASLLHPLVDALAARLGEHNRTARALNTIRVRMAVHAGDVHISDGHVVGGSLEFLARLLEAEPLRRALALAPRSVAAAIAVSSHIYDEVVRHRYPGIDPDTYHRVEFAVKETKAAAWLHLPGCAWIPPDLAAAPDPSTDVPPEPGIGGLPGIRAGSVNIATGNSHVKEMIGTIGTRIDHVGSVRFDRSAAHMPDLQRLIAELTRAVQEHHRAGHLDEHTYAEAQKELREADSHALSPDREGRRRLLSTLKKLKGLVEEVADLAAKVGTTIAAVRSV